MTFQDLTPQPAFDYGELARDDWQFVHDAADEIRRLWIQTTENVLAIGKHLIEVKDRLDHGQFGRWLASEFDWSDRQARNFMQAYETFGKSEIIADLAKRLQPTALYQLAAPSTPEAAREEVMAKVEAGEHVSVKDVKATVQKHRGGPPAANSPGRIAAARQRGQTTATPSKPEHVEGVDYDVTVDPWGFKHRQYRGKQQRPFSYVIGEAMDILNTMRAVADAAEQGDQKALRQIVEGAKLVTDLCNRLVSWAAAQKGSDTEKPTAAAKPEQRISPRTGKPVRKYGRQKSS